MRFKHSLSTTAALCAALAMAGVHRAHAVELLTSGNFEAPGDVGPVPGWILEEFATGSAAVVNSAENTGGADAQIFLRAFEGGGPLHPAQGNFDDDNLPVGDADGVDFLTWQRGFGKTTGALPSEGDATGGPLGVPDGIINAADFNTWKANFGRALPVFTNARLSQKVPAAEGQTYTFQGTSKFEPNYSGYVATLGDDSPFGQIPSPTTTMFKMEFLNASGNVIGTPTTLNLRTDLGTNDPDFDFVHTPLVGVAPAGTVDVRVSAEALNMAWNGTAGPAPGGTLGLKQSAFFDDFSLMTPATPGIDLLDNGNLNQGLPDALDFWNQQEGPAFTNSFEVLRTAGFANHTTGGSLGVWLSAFLGASSNIDPNWSSVPVDGTISQTVDAVAGGTYTFSGWSRFEGSYSGGVDTITGAGLWPTQPPPAPTSPTVTEIRLDFLDVNSVVIGTSFIDVEAARKADPLSGGVANDNTWRQHTLQAVAPPNTRKARLSASMIDGVYHAGGQQSAFFDDFSLDGPLVTIVSIPEPSSIVGLAWGALLLVSRTRRRTR